MVKPNGALPGIIRLAIHDNQQNQIAESPMTGVTKTGAVLGHAMGYASLSQWQ